MNNIDSNDWPFQHRTTFPLFPEHSASSPGALEQVSEPDERVVAEIQQRASDWNHDTSNFFD